MSTTESPELRKATPTIITHEGIAKNGCTWNVYNGDSRDVMKTLPSNHYDTIITSPPYFWLRDYGHENQIGLEDSVEGFVNNLCQTFDEVYRVMKPSGVFFMNIGDTYYSGKGESKGVDKKSSKRRFGLRAVDKSGGLGIGIKPKSLIGIPWRVTNEMMSRGWVLRSTIIWYRQHALPEAVRDRPRRSYEFIFMLTKHKDYYFNRAPLMEAAQEDMWTITARPKAQNLGTAPYPDELVERCINIGCPEGGKVLDPFLGSGTTARVGLTMNRNVSGIDISEEFCHYSVNQLRSI
ncbi:DNA-methyltransferase [Fibrella aestuarina]|nr:site-specific DNA-methyltransferase [Fibrella aestuarina]